MKTTFLTVAVATIHATIFSAILTATPPASSAELSPVEKLYDDLFHLPAAERNARLIAGAQKEGLLVFTSTRGKAGRDQRKSLEALYPFIKFDHLDVSGQDAAQRFLTEEVAGRHLTDSFDSGVTDIAPLIKKGLIARYPTPATDKIPALYRGFLEPENRWIPWQWNEHGIAYNSAILTPETAPKSYQDLCDPKFKGTVSFEPVDNDFLAGMYNLFGGDEEKLTAWFKCIGENKPIIQRGHSTRLMLMLAGDHAISGENYLYQGVDMNRKNPTKAPFGVVYSAEILSWARVNTIGRNAPHPHAAALFADWTLSDETQQDWANVNRGALTVKHPFIPENAKLVTFGALDEAILARLVGYWQQYVASTKN